MNQRAKGMSQRNHAFDLLCGLCILRMILLHVVGMCGFRNEFWFSKLMAWTFFFMSFFFFKAGYFNKGVVPDFVSYVKDRTRRLLVPYVVWGAIGSVVYFGFMYFLPALKPSLARLKWEHVYTVSHFYGNPPCWFLFSFFSAYVVIGAVSRLRVGRLYGVAVLAFPFVSYWLFREKNPLWMSLNNVFMGLFFFQLGHWWRWIQERACGGGAKAWARLSVIAFSCLLIWMFAYLNRHYHGEYDMSLNKWVQRPWGAGINTVCALVGLSGLMLTTVRRRVPLIGYIGEHSMVFFVAHYPLIFLYRFTCLAFGHSIRHSPADCVLLVLLILVVCRLLVPYIERVPWLSGIPAGSGRQERRQAPHSANHTTTTDT